MAVFAMAPNQLTLLMTLIFLIGILQQGGLPGFDGTAAKVYPTEIRSTGIGWAIGLGRSGAVVGPCSSWLPDERRDSTCPTNFYFFAIPMAIGGLIAYRLHVD